jgi:hypothetical protein
MMNRKLISYAMFYYVIFGIEAYRGLGGAGAVCRRFGVSRPTLFASGCVDMSGKVRLASAREAVAPVILRR